MFPGSQMRLSCGLCLKSTLASEDISFNTPDITYDRAIEVLKKHYNRSESENSEVCICETKC